jgi:hypothetical protein
MSKLTQYLDKPASIVMDAAISVGIGVVAYVLIGIVKPLLPFGDAVQVAGAAVVGAMVYMRARTNSPLNRS